MPTDRDFFNRLMSIVSCKDHVLRPTVLKKLQEENAFQGPLNEQFWDNIMKLLTSPEQKVASIQTLLTLKTKETSHTFVQNYDVFFNKLLNLPETTKSEKIKEALLKLRSSATNPYIYTQSANELLDHLLTKDEGVIDRYLNRFLADVNSDQFIRRLNTTNKRKNRIHLVLDTLDRNVDGELPPIVVQVRLPNYAAGVNIHRRDNLTLDAYNVLSKVVMMIGKNMRMLLTYLTTT